MFNEFEVKALYRYKEQSRRPLGQPALLLEKFGVKFECSNVENTLRGNVRMLFPLSVLMY